MLARPPRARPMLLKSCNIDSIQPRLTRNISQFTADRSRISRAVAHRVAGHGLRSMMMCLIGILPGIASHHGILLHLVVTKNFSGKDMIFKVSFPELALRSGDRGGRRLEARGRYRTAGEQP